MPKDWRPSASLTTMRRRAAVTAALRAYFDGQGVCEVSTPLLSPQATTEPTLANLAVVHPFAASERWYLRTSPEAAMKRLVASGSGDIYQLGPVFRADERGRHHLTEFTLLEWYRVGYTLEALMDDVAGALRAAGYDAAITRLTYGELFQRALGVQVHACETATLAALVAAQGMEVAAADRHDRAFLLDCLYACVLEPALGKLGAVFLHDFPVELRAYARLRDGVPVVAERFELVIDGLELANGYHEIVDFEDQARCFEAENACRVRRRLPVVAPDRAWLAALACGMPACAGVALGVERLLMVLGLGKPIDAVSLFGHELDDDHGGPISSVT